MVSQRTLLITGLAVLAAATPAIAAARKSPAWLSIESPVNPYDPGTRGAALLVHARLVEGSPNVTDLSGSMEGLVNGARRSMPLRLDTTPHLDVFAVRRQWPVEGTWLLRISLHETTAIVTLDAAGNVTSSRVPTESSRGMPLPRAVTAKEIDSTLAASAKR